MKRPSLKPATLSVLHALAVMCVAAPQLSHAQQAADLAAAGAADATNTIEVVGSAVSAVPRNRSSATTSSAT